MAAANSVNVEKVNILWSNAPKDYNGVANTELYVSLRNYQHITFVIQTGAWAAGTAAVTLKQATGGAGTSVGTATKALAFPSYYTKTSADDLATKVTATSNTFNIDTANKMYIIEIDGSALDVANGFDCICLAVATPGANADLYSAIAILSDARQQVPLTALTD